MVGLGSEVLTCQLPLLHHVMSNVPTLGARVQGACCFLDRLKGLLLNPEAAFAISFSAFLCEREHKFSRLVALC